MADMITNGESFALKGTPYGFVSKTLPKRRFEIERGHEKGHTKIRLKSYSSPLPKSFLENRWGKGNYMVEGNGDEQAIRFSQFKAYLGKDDISAEDLKYISENYVKDTGIDNNITDLFDAIKDYSKEHPQIWEEMAKWGTEIAPVGLATLYLKKE